MERFEIQQSNLSWRSLALCSTELAREKLSFKRAVQLSSLPLGLFERDGQMLLSVALSNLNSEKAIRFATGFEISCEVVSEDEIQKAIELAYCGSLSSNNVPELLRKILLKAEFLSSSDIHIEPDSVEARVRFRRDGRLVSKKINSIPLLQYKEFVRHIKVQSLLDTTERNRSQEGVLNFKISNSNKKVRVSILPVLHGEKIALRLQANQFLERSELDGTSSFLDLGLLPSQVKMLQFSLGMDRGCILVAGATGSGKTTLLYSALRALDCTTLNVITVEDPIEYELASVNQIRVTGCLTEILPSVLRQDPDVVMVGEIRKPKSADLALGAALTGSLVLSSVHASNALEAITRLSDMGVSNSKIASSVKLIIASRLVAKNCPHCRDSFKAPLSFLTYFKLGQQSLSFSSGCEMCDQTGVLGRQGVYEFLPMTRSLREALLSYQKPTLDGESFFELARLGAYQPIQSQMSDLLSRGMVSPQEVCKSLGLQLSMFE